MTTANRFGRHLRTLGGEAANQAGRLYSGAKRAKNNATDYIGKTAAGITAPVNDSAGLEAERLRARRRRINFSDRAIRERDAFVERGNQHAYNVYPHGQPYDPEMDALYNKHGHDRERTALSAPSMADDQFPASPALQPPQALAQIPGVNDLPMTPAPVAPALRPEFALSRQKAQPGAALPSPATQGGLLHPSQTPSRVEPPPQTSDFTAEELNRVAPMRNLPATPPDASIPNAAGLRPREVMVNNGERLDSAITGTRRFVDGDYYASATDRGGTQFATNMPDRVDFPAGGENQDFRQRVNPNDPNRSPENPGPTLRGQAMRGLLQRNRYKDTLRGGSDALKARAAEYGSALRGPGSPSQKLGRDRQELEDAELAQGRELEKIDAAGRAAAGVKRAGVQPQTPVWQKADAHNKAGWIGPNGFVEAENAMPEDMPEGMSEKNNMDAAAEYEGFIASGYGSEEDVVNWRNMAIGFRERGKKIASGREKKGKNNRHTQSEADMIATARTAPGMEGKTDAEIRVLLVQHGHLSG